MHIIHSPRYNKLRVDEPHSRRRSPDVSKNIHNLVLTDHKEQIKHSGTQIEEKSKSADRSDSVDVYDSKRDPQVSFSVVCAIGKERNKRRNNYSETGDQEDDSTVIYKYAISRERHKPYRLSENNELTSSESITSPTIESERNVEITSDEHSDALCGQIEVVRRSVEGRLSDQKELMPVCAHSLPSDICQMKVKSGKEKKIASNNIEDSIKNCYLIRELHDQEASGQSDNVPPKTSPNQGDPCKAFTPTQFTDSSDYSHLSHELKFGKIWKKREVIMTRLPQKLLQNETSQSSTLSLSSINSRYPQNSESYVATKKDAEGLTKEKLDILLGTSILLNSAITADNEGLDAGFQNPNSHKPSDSPLECHVNAFNHGDQRFSDTSDEDGSNLLCGGVLRLLRKCSGKSPSKRNQKKYTKKSTIPGPGSSVLPTAPLSVLEAKAVDKPILENAPTSIPLPPDHVESQSFNTPTDKELHGSAKAQLNQSTECNSTFFGFDSTRNSMQMKRELTEQPIKQQMNHFEVFQQDDSRNSALSLQKLEKTNQIMRRHRDLDNSSTMSNCAPLVCKQQEVRSVQLLNDTQSYSSIDDRMLEYRNAGEIQLDWHSMPSSAHCEVFAQFINANKLDEIEPLRSSESFKLCGVNEQYGKRIDQEVHSMPNEPNDSAVEALYTDQAWMTSGSIVRLASPPKLHGIQCTGPREQTNYCNSNAVCDTKMFDFRGQISSLREEMQTKKHLHWMRTLSDNHISFGTAMFASELNNTSQDIDSDYQETKTMSLPRLPVLHSPSDFDELSGNEVCALQNMKSEHTRMTFHKSQVSAFQKRLFPHTVADFKYASRASLLPCFFGDSSYSTPFNVISQSSSKQYRCPIKVHAGGRHQNSNWRIQKLNKSHLDLSKTSSCNCEQDDQTSLEFSSESLDQQCSSPQRYIIADHCSTLRKWSEEASEKNKSYSVTSILTSLSASRCSFNDSCEVTQVEIDVSSEEIIVPPKYNTSECAFQQVSDDSIQATRCKNKASQNKHFQTHTNMLLQHNNSNSGFTANEAINGGFRMNIDNTERISTKDYALPGMPEKKKSLLEQLRENRVYKRGKPSLLTPSYSWDPIKDPNEEQPEEEEEIATTRLANNKPAKLKAENSNSIPEVAEVMDSLKKVQQAEERLRSLKNEELLTQNETPGTEAQSLTAQEVLTKNLDAPVIDYKERRRLRLQSKIEEERRELLALTENVIRERKNNARSMTLNDSSQLGDLMFRGTTRAMFDPNAPIMAPKTIKTAAPSETPITKNVSPSLPSATVATVSDTQSADANAEKINDKRAECTGELDTMNGMNGDPKLSAVKKYIKQPKEDMLETDSLQQPTDVSSQQQQQVPQKINRNLCSCSCSETGPPSPLCTGYPVNLGQSSNAYCHQPYFYQPPPPPQPIIIGYGAFPQSIPSWNGMPMTPSLWPIDVQQHNFHKQQLWKGFMDYWGDMFTKEKACDSSESSVATSTTSPTGSSSFETSTDSDYSHDSSESCTSSWG